MSQTLHLRNEARTVNGVTGFALGTSNTASDHEAYFDVSAFGSAITFCARIRRKTAAGVITVLKDWTSIYADGGEFALAAKTLSLTPSSPSIGGTDVFILDLGVADGGTNVLASNFVPLLLTQGAGVGDGAESLSVWCTTYIQDEVWYSSFYFGGAHDSTLTVPDATLSAPTSPGASAGRLVNTVTATMPTGTTGAKVYAGSSANPTTLIATVSASAGAFSYDDALTPTSGTYHYRVKAVGAGGDSDYSADASCTRAWASSSAAQVTNAPACDDRGRVTVIGAGSGTTSKLYRYGSAGWREVTNLPYCWMTKTGTGPWTWVTRLPWCGDSPVPLGSAALFAITTTSSGTESALSSPVSVTAAVVKATAEADRLAAWEAYTEAIGGDYVDDSTTFSTWPMLYRAVAYELDPTAPNLLRVSQQWDYAKTKRNGAGHAYPGWWYCVGSPPPGGYGNIDNGGRQAWHVYMAAQLLRSAGEFTLSADMLDCVDGRNGATVNALDCYFNHFSDYSYTISPAIFGKTSVTYHWRNDSTPVDAPNQLLWFASLLAMLYKDPGSPYYEYAGSLTYINHAIDFAWNAQDAAGFISWSWGNTKTSTLYTQHYSNYHDASVESLTSIRMTMGDAFSTRLNAVAAAAAGCALFDAEPHMGEWDSGQAYPVTWYMGAKGVYEVCRAALGLSDPTKGYDDSAAWLTSDGVAINEFDDSAGGIVGTDTGDRLNYLQAPLMRFAILGHLPAAPSAVTISKAGTTVTTGCTDNATDETSVEVALCSDGVWGTAVSLAANTTTHDFTGASGSTFKTRWRAVNASGASAWIESATISTATPVSVFGTIDALGRRLIA